MKVFRVTYKAALYADVRFNEWFDDRTKAKSYANTARATGRPCSVRAVTVPTDDPAKMLRWLNKNAYVYS
jgi:hypothetical protein